MTTTGEDIPARRADFPTKQLAILLACRLVEPLAVTSMVPYLLFMVQHVGGKRLRDDDAEATRMVTLLLAAYSGAQFATNMLWGRMSDSVGRRPVMLFGLASVLVGTIGFGFSNSISAMFVFRIIPGFLSGNTVIVRTIIGEITRGRDHKARAFAMNQMAYQIGCVVGPMLGGYLAQPCEQFPRICRNDRFPLLQAFPFALPNIVISILAAFSLVVGYFFIDESLEDKVKPQQRRPTPTNAPEDEQAPLLSSSTSQAEPKRHPSTFSAICTGPVINVVLSYFLMSLHTICFDQIFPVFLATRRAPSTPPFSLNGGLNFPASTVANFIAGSGILSITLMLILFPPVFARLGSVTSLRISLFLYPFAYFALPYLVLLPLSPVWIEMVGVSVVVSAKILAAVFSFNGSAVLLNVCAPSARTLGLVNGLAQTAAAASRVVGPAMMGLFIEFGSKIGCGSIGWWLLAVVASGGALQGFWVVDFNEADEDEDW